jgi:hypothetical protein
LRSVNAAGHDFRVALRSSPRESELRGNNTHRKKSASLLRVIESGSVQRAVFMDEDFIYSKDRLVFFKIYFN